MPQLKPWLEILFWLIIINISGLLMVAVNRLDLPGQIHTLETNLDRAIPLILPFIIIYLLFFGYIWIGPLALIKNHAQLLKPLALSMLTVGLITALINLTFQTTAPRAYLPGNDIFSGLLRWHYSLNRPLTSFPSLHTSHSLCLSYYLGLAFPKQKIWFTLIAISVAFSTLFVKQHYIPDVLVGICLAIVSNHFIYYIWQKSYSPLPTPTQTKGVTT